MADGKRVDGFDLDKVLSALGVVRRDAMCGT